MNTFAQPNDSTGNELTDDVHPSANVETSLRRPVKYDFTKHTGLAIESADQLSEWLSAFCGLLKEFWYKTTETSRTFSARYEATTTFKECRPSFSASSVAYQINIGFKKIPSILLIERPIAIAYSLEMTGDKCAKLPPDRQISPIENALIECLFEQFAALLGEAWPHQEPIQTALGTLLETPHRSRIFSPEEVVVTHHISIEAAFGKHSLIWVAPKSLFEELFSPSEDLLGANNSESKALMEKISLLIPIGIRVILGETSVRVSDLPAIKQGDVIVLNQKISEPLPVTVGEQHRFLAWPARKGSRQSIQIETIY